MVCEGGSSKMKSPGGISMPAVMMLYTPPLPEMKLSRSVRTRPTSAWRLTA